LAGRDTTNREPAGILLGVAWGRVNRFGKVDMSEGQQTAHLARARIVDSLSLVEDAVYVGLGVLLTALAFTLLVIGFRQLGGAVFAGGVGEHVVDLLDRILLVLLVIELLYTVQVSFREHGLVAEPFLVVALIAVIRRILVLTAELPKLPQAGESIFRHAIIELGVLTVMIVVLVGSLVVLQRQAKQPSKG
jgi:uncharacterized membrane protein (DUF373 family)